MGKSTVAGMFAAAGIPAWDADDAVHRLYGPGGAGAAAIETIAPSAVGAAGVDRGELSRLIAADAALLAKIEALIHPLVAEDRRLFTEDHHDAAILLFDIPLLFENGSERDFDYAIVVSAPEDVQTARVMARPGMTEEKLTFIKSRQMPDAEKRQRADFIIENGGSLAETQAQVDALIEKLSDA